MSFIEVFLIGVGLAMDAFAVSICKGLSIKKTSYKNVITIALYFSIFQALMPLIGYLIGSTFESLITTIDHWLAFILLNIIGINMIKESKTENSETINDKVDFKTMFVLAIATSIDALTIGITFAFLKTNIFNNILTIGITTFIITSIGVLIGKKFGSKYEKKSQILGGLILIFMGIKILIDHIIWLKYNDQYQK